jgi:hypothetical protein
MSPLSVLALVAETLAFIQTPRPSSPISALRSGVIVSNAGGPSLLVVGCGVLGRLAAKEWQERKPGGCEVLGVTRTRPDEEREAAMAAEGIKHRYRSDIEASVRCGQRFPFVIFSASPSGNTDYVGTAKRGGRFVFTSSAGVYAEQNGGIVTESSPVTAGPRTDMLLAAEDAVLAAGGCVVRLAGLYLEERGAHNYWLTQDEVEQRSDGLINQVHYRDAADCTVAALLFGSPGALYVAADDKPLTREQICVEACRGLPNYAGCSVPAFTGADGGVGKVIDSSRTRNALNWQPKYPTFGAFVGSLAAAAAPPPAAAPPRTDRPQAAERLPTSAEGNALDSALRNLEATLGRQLTSAETGAARTALWASAVAVDNVVDQLTSRLGGDSGGNGRPMGGDGRPIEQLNVLKDGPDLEPAVRDLYSEDDAQKRPAGGAARAAATWGSWRIRAPSDARARARHVLIESEPEAISLLRQLHFGADIESLAAEHSLDSTSKDSGGDLGEFRPGDMSVEFDQFIFDEANPVGIPLGPVKTPFGYHVVIIDERSNGS